MVEHIDNYEYCYLELDASGEIKINDKFENEKSSKYKIIFCEGCQEMTSPNILQVKYGYQQH